MKRKEFIKSAGLFSASLSLLADTNAAQSFLDSIEKKIKIVNPLATQNTVIIILGGGIRWEFENSKASPSLYQSYTRSVMPNLFNPGQVGIRDLEVLLKSTLNQKILNSSIESSGKFLFRKSDEINHNDALSKVLGFENRNSSLKTNGKFNLSENSPFTNHWINNIKKRDKLFYHHDLPGISRKIFSENELLNKRLDQFLIQHVTTQKNFSDIPLAEPLPMFKESLSYIQEFKPKVSIIHPRLLDIAHSDFRQALINMNRVDFSIAWLISQLQSTNPSFMMNTNWFILPEHGRNTRNNGRMDKSKLMGCDHNQEEAKNSWMLVQGPKIKAATGLQELIPFAPKQESKETFLSNIDVFNTIKSLSR